MGTGVSVSVGLAAPQSASGGAPTPPFAFPEYEMMLGMGLAGISSYSGYYPFANIMPNAERWQRQSGTSDWTQEWGELTVANQDDTFYAKLAEGDAIASMPDGVYTVINPDGCEIGVGWGGTPNLTDFQTDGEFTFTKSGGSIVALYAKGNVTNNAGPIQVIMPGLRDAVLAGNRWNPAFITFLSGLGVSCLRFMDWFNAYTDISTDWADAPPDAPIMLRSPQTRLSTKVPYSWAISLANQLGIDPYINVPARATDDFVTELATKLRDELSSSRYVYVAGPGNETWNTSDGYLDARSWVAHLYNTEYSATPNSGINGWTRVGHGLVTGNLIAQFFDRRNYTVAGGLYTWPMGFGNLLYVERVDDDNFKLHQWSGTEGAPVMGSVVNIGSLNGIIYKKHVEAGKTVDVDTNHGIRAKQIWDIFNSVLGSGRCVNVMETQLANASATTARLAPSGVRAACDAIAGASYYQGDWWVPCVDLASGQATPKVWSRNPGGSVRIAIYASGSTPTYEQIMAGTGTGYVGHRDLSGWAEDADTYTSGSAITGLANGTSYEFRAVLSGSGGYKWTIAGQFTASASASTVAFYDSDANMAMRARQHTVETILPWIAAQAVVADGIPLIEYECGSDYFGDDVPLTEVKAWRTAYTQTATAGDVFGHFYTAHSAAGLKLMIQFVDCNGNTGVFNLTEGFDDTADYRYQKFVDFFGSIPNSSPLAIGDVSASNISTEPSYPAVAYTFADAALSYSIFNGDPNGNFTIVGDELRLANGTGINWSDLTASVLTIEASNGVTTAYFTVSLVLGDGFIPSALFGVGDYGFVLDFSDAATLFEDDPPTNPAELNDSIRSARDVSGLSTDFNGPTSQSPLWKQSGAVFYAESDGTDDHLRHNAAGLYAGGAATIVIGLRGAAQSDKVIIGEGSSSSNNPLYCIRTGTSSTSAVYVSYRNTAGTTVLSEASGSKLASFLDGTDKVLTFDDDGSTARLRANGGAWQSQAYTRSASAFDRTGLAALIRSTPNLFFSGRVYAVIAIDRQLTGPELADAEAWVTDRLS